MHLKIIYLKLLKYFFYIRIFYIASNNRVDCVIDAMRENIAMYYKILFYAEETISEMLILKSQTIFVYLTYVPAYNIHF